MNPKIARKFEEALTVTVSSLVGFGTSLWLTGSFVHALIVALFCCAVFTSVVK